MGRPRMPFRNVDKELDDLRRALVGLREACGDPTDTVVAELGSFGQRRMTQKRVSEVLHEPRSPKWWKVEGYLCGCWEHARRHGIPVDGVGDYAPWAARFEAAGGTFERTDHKRSEYLRGQQAPRGPSPAGSGLRRSTIGRLSPVQKATATALVLLIVAAVIGVAFALPSASSTPPSQHTATLPTVTAGSGPPVITPTTSATNEKCGAPGISGVLSPQNTAFTHVTVLGTLGIKGLSAKVEQGAVDGRLYVWIYAASPDERGALQLHWIGTDGTPHYCNAAFTGVAAGQPITTMAVPKAIDGTPTPLQECIWRTDVTFAEQCVPPSLDR